MLEKKFRLNREKEIKKVLRTGLGIKGGLLDIKYSKSGHKQARFLFLVSAKVSKKAHERNFVKRHLREIFFRFLPKIEKNDYAVIAKKNILGKSQSEIEAEVFRLLQSAGVLGR